MELARKKCWALKRGRFDGKAANPSGAMPRRKSAILPIVLGAMRSGNDAFFSVTSRRRRGTHRTQPSAKKPFHYLKTPILLNTPKPAKRIPNLFWVVNSFQDLQ